MRGSAASTRTMHLLALVLCWAGAGEGGGPGCPPLCRCASEGTQVQVDCVDVGLRAFPSNLSSFTFRLDLSMNRLERLPARACSRLGSLQELRLAGNGLTEIHRDAFAGLSALRVLTLHNNQLRKVPSEALENLRNLRSLRLDANSIARLPATCLRGLPSLRHLWLDDNALTHVPVAALGVLMELQALNLALNSISHVPDRAFANLHQLMALHLHDNRIESLGQRCFDGLRNLEILDLSYNRINKFPTAIRRLSNLREINLQSNNVTVIPEDAFKGNPSLQTLNMWNNPIHTVGHSALQLLPELRTLSTADRRVPPGRVHKEPPDLQQLDLNCRLIHNLRSVALRGKESAKEEPLEKSLLPANVQDSAEGSSSSTCASSLAPRLLLLIVCLLFLAAVIFSLWSLVSIFSSSSFSSSAPGPASSKRLLALLFWFRLLAGLSGVALSIGLVSTSSPKQRPDPGSGLASFLCSVSSEACVFLLVAAVLGHRSGAAAAALRRVGVTGAACCSLALTVVAMEMRICLPWLPCEGTSTALLLFNTSCFLFTSIVHTSPPRPRGDAAPLPTEAAALTFLLLSNAALSLCLLSFSSLLHLPALLSPDVPASAVQLCSWALPCCLDPLIYVILGTRVTGKL